MSNWPFLAISEEINTKIKELQEDCGRGTAADFGEYKFACGIIRGLGIANGYVQDMAAKLLSGEDEE